VPLKKKLKKFLRSNEFIVLLIILIVSFVFGSINPAFYSTRNLFELIRSMTVNLIFGCGVMMIIVNGGVDLSFMAIAVVTSYLTIQGSILLGYDGPISLIFLVAAIMGMLIGFINAYLISKFDMPVFIVTLSVASVIRGLVLAFIGNEYVASTHMPGSTIALSRTFLFSSVDAQGSTYGLHAGILIALGILIVTYLILNYTSIGRGVYALGGDAVSASRIGFNLRKVRLFIFGYAGFLAGIAGIIYVSNNRMADPISLQGQELAVIAAVVMGGTRISGGKGSVVSVFLGVLLTQMILTNLVIIGVPSFWHRFTFGALVVSAVVLQSIRENGIVKLAKRE
jgi:simple sugar transport system permease protein